MHVETVMAATARDASHVTHLKLLVGFNLFLFHQFYLVLLNVMKLQWQQ